MKNRFIASLVVLFVFGITFFYTIPSFAEENVDELKAQIEALQKRVDELEGIEKTQEQEEDFYPVFFRARPVKAWDPFEEMIQMQEEMDRMFQHSFSQRGLGGTGMFSNNMTFDTEIDVKETKKGYDIIVDMSGFDQDKIDIQINKHSITVKGEYKAQEQEEKDDAAFHAYSFGSFVKTIPVPNNADTTKVKTEKKDGKLVIQLPKKK